MEYPKICTDLQHDGSAQTGQSHDQRFSRRLEPFSPLLHDLITWDLVYRAESGSFALREDVQRWLEEVSARQSTSTPPEVYVGRPCQRCGAIGVTRMIGGLRVCDTCRQAPAGDEEELADARKSRRNGHHDPRSWWAHKAG